MLLVAIVNGSLKSIFSFLRITISYGSALSKTELISSPLARFIGTSFKLWTAISILLFSKAWSRILVKTPLTPKSYKGVIWFISPSDFNLIIWQLIPKDRSFFFA